MAADPVWEDHLGDATAAMPRLDHNPAILFLHDGELGEISSALESLGGQIVERTRGLEESDRQCTWDLVIASSKRMLALPGQLARNPHVRIAVLDGDSKTVRSMLRRAGTDLVVRRPVHPAALRLLILYTLYRGPEKRRATRVSVGASVRFRTGLRRRNAILAELSATGCRLLAPVGSNPPEPGGSLTILLPPELCQGRALSLHGRAARVDQPDAGTLALAVRFDKMRSGTRQRLHQLVDAHAAGPAILDEHAAGLLPASEPAEPSAPEVAPGAASPERRDGPRHAMAHRIIALGDQAARVLIGSDLSAGGMRVEPTPGLEIGDRLKIALHVHSGEQPLLLGAEVVRSDPETGQALRFLEVDALQRARLDELLAELPTVSQPEPEAGSSGGLWVSELLGHQTG